MRRRTVWLLIGLILVLVLGLACNFTAVCLYNALRRR